MNKAVFCGLGLSMALSACSPESGANAGAMETDGSSHSGHQMMQLSEKAVRDKKEAAGLLVDRFDIGACEKADLLGSVGRTNADGTGSIQRGYQSSVECAQAVISAVKERDFAEKKPGTFSSSSSDGTFDEITIVVMEDGSGATIEWEVGNK